MNSEPAQEIAKRDDISVLDRIEVRNWELVCGSDVR